MSRREKGRTGIICFCKHSFYFMKYKSQITHYSVNKKVLDLPLATVKAERSWDLLTVKHAIHTVVTMNYVEERSTKITGCDGGIFNLQRMIRVNKMQEHRKMASRNHSASRSSKYQSDYLAKDPKSCFAVHVESTDHRPGQETRSLNQRREIFKKKWNMRESKTGWCTL